MARCNYKLDSPSARIRILASKIVRFEIEDARETSL